MDIEKLILSQLPGGLDKIIENTGVDRDTVSKIIKTGSEELVKEGIKTKGGLFENIEKNIIIKTITEKTGIDTNIVSKVIDFALPYIKEHVDGGKILSVIKGLSDGVGMDDVENIAGSILGGTGKKGGFLGGIFKTIFGKK